MERLYPNQFVFLMFIFFNYLLISNPLQCCNNYENYKDSCYVDQLRTTMVEFINGDNNNVYKDDFLVAIKKNNAVFGDCYFPRSNDLGKFWCFIEKKLVKESKKDERALRLLLDLSIIYKNNAELSAELFTQSINKVALYCIECFISELFLRSIQEIDFFIHKLDYLNDEDAKMLLTQIDAIKEPDYQLIIEKIKNILN